MKIYTILLFAVAALLSVLGILLCCGKPKHLKFESHTDKKIIGTCFLSVSALLIAFALIIIFDVKGALFLLVFGSFIISRIFILLRSSE